MYLDALTPHRNLGQPANARVNVGVPPPQSHVEAPPYDAALDGSWKHYLNPHDHAFRNHINGMSPEERQMLLNKMAEQRSLPPLPPGI